MVCIVVECDMDKDQFFGVNSENEIKSTMRKHLAEKKTCRYLIELVNKFVL